MPEEEMVPEPLVLTAIAVLVGIVGFGGEDGRKASEACPAPGAWVDPSTGAALAAPAAIDALSAGAVVLLGEGHDDSDHHRWQLQTVAAIHGRDSNLALGFEALPRSAQPVLDTWVEGRLGEEDFLAGTRWKEVWGFDPQLSMPLFHFARMHRTPAFGLNVPRSLVRRVSREGWSAVPPAEREGIGEPASPAPRYVDNLLEAFGLHRPPGSTAPQADDAAFRRFVEAQQLWDRAMAEAIAEEVRRSGRRVVAMVGRGHLEFGYGIPAQLRDLGLQNVVVALPWPADEPCPTPAENARVADLLFMVAGPAQPGSR